MKALKLSFLLILFFAIKAYPFEQNLIINVDRRLTVSLNGKWLLYDMVIVASSMVMGKVLAPLVVEV